jgi:LPS-assembly protein
LNNTFNRNSIFKNKLLGNLKNINYETKNVDEFKKDTTNELFGGLGYLTQLHLKKENNFGSHLLKPKFLLRYAPGSMRKETDGNRLTPLTAFSMDRLDNLNNFETGLSATVGLDYEISDNNKKFDFSVAQIINEKENKRMASKTSLDEKLSDLVGSSKVEVNEKLDLIYNFSLDQNYKAFNYNEFNSNFNFDPMKIGFGYILENNHIGDQEYFKTKIDYTNKNSLVSFETKRNLISDSSEFYNLSYEYMNDCLRAGLVYRREFYNDSELEPENSLMFKITLTPFGSISSPSVSR